MAKKRVQLSNRPGSASGHNPGAAHKSYGKPAVPSKARRITLGGLPHRLTVVCVWWGNKFGIEYVERLKNMVARNMPGAVRYDFICITPFSDEIDGVFRIHPASTAEGWWQKVGLFDPNLFGPSQRILYIDLDIVIRGSLEKVVRAQDPFCMLDNFGPNRGYCAHNSSVMLWTPTEKTHRISTDFGDHVMRELHGDQDWIWRVMSDDIRCFLPESAQSYKYDKLTEDSSIVVFHGDPKQDKVSDPWVAAHWR